MLGFKKENRAFTNPDLLVGEIGTISGGFSGVLGGIGGFVGDYSLPNSDTDSAKRGEHQSASKPRDSLIGFNLLALEFMLFACACIFGALSLFVRSIKNDISPFSMEGVIAAILFVIGQLFVYLALARMYETRIP